LPQNEREIMHLLLFVPVLATDGWVAPSAATFIVILSVLAILSSFKGSRGRQ